MKAIWNDKVIVNSTQISIQNLLHEVGMEQVREEILKGLLVESKYISSKYFYDEKGSELFDQITTLPEYYPPVSEKQILKNLPLSFIKSFNNLNIIEIGSGNHSKISLILNKIPDLYLNSVTYMPIDISDTAILRAGNELLNLYPEISIEGLVADFTTQLDCIPVKDNRLFCFLGSTIGNFTPAQIDQFLSKMSDILHLNEYFLVGFDNKKDIDTLEKAYNDIQGVTAAFNLNILYVANRLAGTDFNTSDFMHVSFYNKNLHRIEMHLEAIRDIEIKSNYITDRIKFQKGERIHTENSHKFDNELINKIANKAGLSVKEIFTDKKNMFSVALLQKRML